MGDLDYLICAFSQKPFFIFTLFWLKYPSFWLKAIRFRLKNPHHLVLPWE